MPGICVDRLLASTAIVLLLSAAAGGAIAEPMKDNVAAIAMPDAANSATPATAYPDKPSAAPAQTPDTPQTPAVAPSATPAAAVPTPDAATPQPSGASAAPAATPAATQTPAAASATPAAGALSAADAPIADQLRELANGKFDHVIGTKKDRTQIDAFYSGRNYAPLWITDGTRNDRAKAAISYLSHVDADGLDPADYPVPNFNAASDPAALADADVRFTMSVINYAHHASIGRVHWSRVTADAEYDRAAPEPADVLASIVGASDVAAALDSYEPSTPGYLALKAKLADIRAGKVDKGNTPIGNGPVLKAGMQDDRVPQLRDRLGVPGDGGTSFDKPLADAVKKFQQQHQIAVTGTLTAATIDAFNGPQPDHVADVILANMERWRWMPHQFASTYVIVNLPDFTLRVMHEGKLVWTTKIVIGKPDMPTPIMTADMKYITINPTWNVPPSIINREYLPALQQDPQAMDRIGLKVVNNPDGTVRIYQPPGERNALGRIRFNFPNKFLVYQHDTPDKNLFAYDKRAFSHGCMRVQDPAKYAEVLLSLARPADGYTEDRIKKMFGTNETDIQLPNYIPVNLTYQTAFVDDDGKLEFRDDVYGRDKALLAILKGDDRKVADVAIEHHEDAAHREALAIPDQPSLFGGRNMFGGGSNYTPGDNFFSRLFGGFAAAPPPVQHRPVTHARKETRAQQNTIER